MSWRKTHPGIQVGEYVSVRVEDADYTGYVVRTTPDTDPLLYDILLDDASDDGIITRVPAGAITFVHLDETDTLVDVDYNYPSRTAKLRTYYKEFMRRLNIAKHHYASADPGDEKFEGDDDPDVPEFQYRSSVKLRL